MYIYIIAVGKRRFSRKVIDETTRTTIIGSRHCGNYLDHLPTRRQYVTGIPEVVFVTIVAAPERKRFAAFGERFKPARAYNASVTARDACTRPHFGKTVVVTLARHNHYYVTTPQLLLNVYVRPRRDTRTVRDLLRAAVVGERRHDFGVKTENRSSNETSRVIFRRFYRKITGDADVRLNRRLYWNDGAKTLLSYTVGTSTDII